MTGVAAFELTAEQRLAVRAPEGPMLIVAGPGAGKTAVLAARIAYLVQERAVGAASILALAFGAKAARELRCRLDASPDAAMAAVEVRTFHAFGLRLVRQWQADIGYRPGPLTIYGEATARALLSEVATTLSIGPDRWPLPKLAQAVERYRLTGETAPPIVTALTTAYEARLIERGALDYPAMLLLPLRLLVQRPDMAACYQVAYHAILIDESQDVCPAQYVLARLLAARHHHLVLVGDPAQSLYGWRGADGRALRSFPSDFPETRIVALRQNFRSTARIVEVANAVGAGLQGRMNLWTSNPLGPTPVLHVANDEHAEVYFVADEITRLYAEGLVRNFGEIAVLFRTNEQAHSLVLALRSRQIPCGQRGTDDLQHRREVGDVLAYLRLACDPTDGHALARIVDVPPRGLASLATILRAHPLPVAALGDVARRLNVPASRLERLVALLHQLRDQATVATPTALVDMVLERSGYRTWLVRQPDGAVRLRHVLALRSLAGHTPGDLATWLAELELGELPDQDAAQHVHLLTVHAAKGSEWPVVFVVGWEEGLLPHARAVRDGVGGLQEERCIAYVAVTRPQSRLYLTCCRSRQSGNRRVAVQPSRFLPALPPDIAAAA